MGGLTVLTLPGGLEMLFQHIVPGGITSDGVDCPETFRMGSRGERSSEEPILDVWLTQPFYLGVFPVTQEQFLAWKPDHDFRFPADSERPEELRRPAENVSWNAAMGYCRWLNDVCRDHLPVGYSAVLPSEVQWEYACRSGTETEYSTGDGVAALLEAGWFSGNSEQTTHPIGEKAANGFGLYDMHGNVDEWCRDEWDEHAYKRRIDGACDLPTRAGDDESFRVVRGGSWFGSARYCRSACRYRGDPGNWDGGQGFRVCLVSGSCPVSSPDETNAERGSVGEARRDDAAGPQRTSEALATSEDLSQVSFPPRSRS